MKVKLKSRNFSLKQTLMVVFLTALLCVGLTSTYYILASPGEVAVEPLSFSAGASYIIGKDGSTIYARNGKTGEIDYSGTDASTVIQSAIDASSSGIIFIQKGIYELHPTKSRLNTEGATADFTAQIALELKSNITLTGERDTVLRFMDNVAGAVVIFIPPGTTYARVENLQIEMSSGVNQADSYLILGNGASNSNVEFNLIQNNIFGYSRHGVLWRTYCWRNKVKNNFFNNSGYSMHTYSTPGNRAGLNVWEGNIVYSGIEGVDVEWAVSELIANNLIYYTRYSGIVVQISNALVIGNLIHEAGTNSVDGNFAGIWLRYYPDDTIVVGNQIYESWDQAILVGDGGKNILIANNHIRNANVRAYRVGGTTYSAIEVYDSATNPFENNMIINNMFYQYYQEHQIYSGNLNGQNNIIAGNFLPPGSGGNPAINVGSGWDIKRNYLWVTESSGTATVANNEYITHGLADTPSVVLITPKEMLYDGVTFTVGVVARNSTHFQVGVYWTNGTAITDDVIDIDWYAEV